MIMTYELIEEPMMPVADAMMDYLLDAAVAVIPLVMLAALLFNYT